MAFLTSLGFTHKKIKSNLAEFALLTASLLIEFFS